MKNHVIIFGKKIKIVKKDGLVKNEEAFAIYDSEKFIIYIDSSLPKNTALESLFHECGHALFHRAGLSQSKIISDLEEVIVEQFAIMFAENFLPKPRQKKVKK